VLLEVIRDHEYLKFNFCLSSKTHPKLNKGVLGSFSVCGLVYIASFLKNKYMNNK
jgi:hypothetical protein